MILCSAACARETPNQQSHGQTSPVSTTVCSFMQVCREQCSGCTLAVTSCSHHAATWGSSRPAKMRCYIHTPIDCLHPLPAGRCPLCCCSCSLTLVIRVQASAHCMQIAAHYGLLSPTCTIDAGLWCDVLQGHILQTRSSRCWCS